MRFSNDKNFVVSIKDVTNYLEQVAPLAYQEGYDNAGLLIGEEDSPVTGILICLDVTEAVLREAKAKDCNLVISHHPLIFYPINQLTGKNYTERCVAYAIKQDIAIYSLHTNLDNVAQGINRKIAYDLDLQNVSILLPKQDILGKLTTFAPRSSVESILQALYAAGAGYIGNYTHCGFVNMGTGSFKPTAVANPCLGTPRQLEQVEEGRIEVIFPLHSESAVLRALHVAHPYENVAYYVQKIENTDSQVGAGMLGELLQPLGSEDFLQYLKFKMHLACMRHTCFIERPIKRVAVCGGSGSFLIQPAIQQQADVLITADMKYHDFFKAENKILIADIGHYESELGAKSLIHTLLSEKFANIVLLQCEAVTNPVHFC